jgi:hypothetical protein
MKIADTRPGITQELSFLESDEYYWRVGRFSDKMPLLSCPCMVLTDRTQSCGEELNIREMGYVGNYQGSKNNLYCPTIGLSIT